MLSEPPPSPSLTHTHTGDLLAKRLMTARHGIEKASTISVIFTTTPISNAQVDILKSQLAPQFSIFHHCRADL